MSKLSRVEKAIEKSNNPTKVVMSRSFAIALKQEMVPVMDQHFIDGRMTVRGLPWEIAESVRGFRIE